MKDYLAILKRNFVSPIVIAIFVLAAILLFLGERRDAWFISFVILVNTLIAVVQEIRALFALKKLEIMSAPHARRIMENGEVEDVLYKELLVGDTIILQQGDEVPADGKILESHGLEINESILTGESASVAKQTGSIVNEACIVTSGSATVKVSSIGANTRAGKMTSSLKKYRPVQTPLQHAISVAISIMTYGALGLAIAIFIVYYLSGRNAVDIFKTITSAAVVVVPEGLLLASSLLLAFGSFKLTRANVLPQKISAIEAMALLDVLCVDKTGTLTSDEIVFEKIEPLISDQPLLNDLIGIVAKETAGKSSTSDSLTKALAVSGSYEIVETLSFSSERKLSGAKIKIDGKIYGVIMGAPEYVSKIAPISDSQKELLDNMTSQGKRVLLVAELLDTSQKLSDIKPNSGRAEAFVVLFNKMRPYTEDTIKYLQDSGVSIRVISGDSPKTVGYVAKLLDIKNSDRIITGEELKNVSKEDWDKTVLSTTIFARVLPEQKERIVAAYKRQGYFTGMVGDGVNDALAVKKSDFGVAMYAGAPATRRVADIVLLDNSFNSLPKGMRLGNRIMQSVELIAALFFHKIIYGIILLLTTLFVGVLYPFVPRNVTYLNFFLVTLPTIMWTIFTPLPRHRLSPKFFWRDTLMAVAPIAILSGLMVTITYSVLSVLYPNDPLGVSTTTLLVAVLFGVYLVVLVPHMFDIKNTKKLRIVRAVYILSVIIMVIASMNISFAGRFFDFTTPVWRDTWALLLLILGVMILQWLAADRAGERLKHRTQIS